MTKTIRYIGPDGGEWYNSANWLFGIPDAHAGQSADLCGKIVVIDQFMGVNGDGALHPYPLRVIDSVGGGCVQLGNGVSIGGMASDAPLLLHADFSAVLVRMGGKNLISSGRFGTIIDESGGNEYLGGSVEFLDCIGAGNNLFDIDVGPGYGRYGQVSIDGGPGRNRFLSGRIGQVNLDDGEGFDVFDGANVEHVNINNGHPHTLTVLGGLIRFLYNGSVPAGSTYNFGGGLIEVLHLGSGGYACKFGNTRILHKSLDGGRTWS